MIASVEAYIVAKSHECNYVLDPIYRPGGEPE